MALLLLMAATAAAQVPLDDNARYLNSFSGLVLGEGRDGLVVGFRGFGLTSRKPRGGFTSGADIDLHGDPDGQIKLATRWLAGIGYLPTPQIRVAAVTGLGVAVGASFTGRSVYATSPDADGGAQAPGAFDTGRSRSTGWAPGASTTRSAAFTRSRWPGSSSSVGWKVS